MRFGPVLLVAASLLVACRPAEEPAPKAGWKVRRLDTPAAGGSGEPGLASGPDGRVFLTWIEATPEGVSTLRVSSRRRGEPWSAPVGVARGHGWFVNWADSPSLLALPDGTLFAHWLAKSAGGGHGYDVRIVASRDAGASWSAPVTPHRDGTFTEHGFVSLAPWPGGGASVVWLDGRATSEPSGPDAAMMLVQTSLDAGGRLGAEATLDPRVCDCCQTAAATTDSGGVVVYRDRSPQEERDISIVRYESGRWSEPVSVHRDGWEMNGCPVNGPAVAADGRRVAVAWFTAAADRPRVKLALSRDSGRSFGPPIDADDGRPVGRVDVALLAGGDVLVSWIEQVGSGAELRVRQFSEATPRRPAVTVADSSSARSSGFPRLEVAGGEPVLAWRDVGQPAGVVTATLERD